MSSEINILDQRFLMNTKFGKYLWYFLACIIHYTHIGFNAITLICHLKCTYNLFLFIIFECRVLWFNVFRLSICYIEKNIRETINKTVVFLSLFRNNSSR